MKKTNRKRSDDFYITLGWFGRWGIILWILFAIGLISLLKQYGWTEETGGMIVSAILLFSIPVSFILTGLYELLGAVFQWKSTICTLQFHNYHHRRHEVTPRKPWTANDRRSTIASGCLFILMGTVWLVVWLVG